MELECVAEASENEHLPPPRVPIRVDSGTVFDVAACSLRKGSWNRWDIIRDDIFGRRNKGLFRICLGNSEGSRQRGYTHESQRGNEPVLSHASPPSPDFEAAKQLAV